MSLTHNSEYFQIAPIAIFSLMYGATASHVFQLQKHLLNCKYSSFSLSVIKTPKNHAYRSLCLSNFMPIVHQSFSPKAKPLSLCLSASLCISLHLSAFLCISLHLSAFLCISLHFSAFLCISLHFSAFLCRECPSTIMSVGYHAHQLSCSSAIMTIGLYTYILAIMTIQDFKTTFQHYS